MCTIFFTLCSFSITVRTPPKHKQPPFRPPPIGDSPLQSHRQSQPATRDTDKTVKPSQPVHVSKPISKVPSSHNVVSSSSEGQDHQGVGFVPPRPVVIGNRSPDSRVMVEITNSESVSLLVTIVVENVKTVVLVANPNPIMSLLLRLFEIPHTHTHTRAWPQN